MTCTPGSIKAAKEMVAVAIANRNPKLAGRAADYMRFVLGFNYRESYKLVCSLDPRITIAEWDELLQGGR